MAAALRVTKITSLRTINTCACGVGTPAINTINNTILNFVAWFCRRERGGSAVTQLVWQFWFQFVAPSICFSLSLAHSRI